ncbi:MAG: C25 family peptidase propeptide domain-containing protein, partial [Candidatus Thorarchaeota archaeon]
MLVGCPFFAVSSLLPDLHSNSMESSDSQTDAMSIREDWTDPLTSTDPHSVDPLDFGEDTSIQDNPYVYDSNPFFDQFSSHFSEVQTYTTEYFDTVGSGYKLTYKMEGAHLFITATIGSYDIMSYSFEEETYSAVQVEGTEISAMYGSPSLPYKNLVLSIPDDSSVLGINTLCKSTKYLDGLEILPGPEPLAISTSNPNEFSLWFDPVQYSSSEFLPSEIMRSSEVGIAGQPALYLSLYPLQFNPSLNQGKLVLEMEIEITFDRTVILSDIITPPESQFGY